MKASGWFKNSFFLKQAPLRSVLFIHVALRPYRQALIFFVETLCQLTTGLVDLSWFFFETWIDFEIIRWSRWYLVQSSPFILNGVALLACECAQCDKWVGLGWDFFKPKNVRILLVTIIGEGGQPKLYLVHLAVFQKWCQLDSHIWDLKPFMSREAIL